MKTTGAQEAGTSNIHGDAQLEVDTAADRIIFSRLRDSGAVETASSEETSDMINLNGKGFSVSFLNHSLLYIDHCQPRVDGHSAILHEHKIRSQ